MLIQALVSAFLLVGSFAQDKDGAYIKHGPTNTKGAKDYDAIMYCQVADKGKSNLYWHCNSANGQQDITVGPDVNTNPALNTKYVIDNKGASVGQYNLIITNVTSLDSGTCSCIVDTGKGNAMEERADLEVMDTSSPPSPPTCTIDKISTPGQTKQIFTADDDIQLKCKSVGGVPLADLHWEIVRQGSAGKGVEIVSSVITESGQGSSQGSITAIANYKLTAADNGAYFQCIQNHAMLANSPRSCSPSFTNENGIVMPVGTPEIPIEVKYLPVLRFVPSSLIVTPTEQLTEVLKCEADSNPGLDDGPTIRFKPSTRDESLNWNYTTEGQENEVTVTVGQSDVGKVLECIASNELGHSVKEIKIESTGLLPTWILVIIIFGAGLILFIIMLLICCICFCENEDEKDAHSMNRSRPGTFQGSELGVDDQYGYNEGGYQDGDLDPEMVNINEFEGGMEMKGDYEAGEDNTGYFDDELLDDDEEEEGAIPPAPPLELKSSASSRTYDEVPM